jgi:hypothetical protein
MQVHAKDIGLTDGSVICSTRFSFDNNSLSSGMS